jgi:hypothetical protein
MSTGAATALVIVASLLFGLGSALLLNVRDLAGELQRRSASWWLRRGQLISSIGPLQIVMPVWAYRFVGLWFCVCSLVIAVTAGRSL